MTIPLPPPSLRILWGLFIKTNSWLIIFHFSTPALVLGKVNIHVDHTLDTWSLDSWDFLCPVTLPHSAEPLFHDQMLNHIITRNLAFKSWTWTSPFVLKATVSLLQLPKCFHCMGILTSKHSIHWTPFLRTHSLRSSFPTISSLVSLFYKFKQSIFK